MTIDSTKLSLAFQIIFQFENFQLVHQKAQSSKRTEKKLNNPQHRLRYFINTDLWELFFFSTFCTLGGVTMPVDQSVQFRNHNFIVCFERVQEVIQCSYDSISSKKLSVQMKVLSKQKIRWVWQIRLIRRMLSFWRSRSHDKIPRKKKVESIFQFAKLHPIVQIGCMPIIKSPPKY